MNRQTTSATNGGTHERTNSVLAALHRFSHVSDKVLFGLFFLAVVSLIAEYGFYLDDVVSDWINVTSVVVVWYLVLDYALKLTVAAGVAVHQRTWSPLRRHFMSKWIHFILSALIVLRQWVFIQGPVPVLGMDFNAASWARVYIAASQVILVLGFMVPLFRYSSRIAATKFHPSQSLLLGFLLLIVIGTLALLLPKATYPGKDLGLLDTLFTATSAVCVTGLTVVDTGSSFTFTGQFILLLLMQAGGIGIVTFATFFAMFFGGGVSVKERMLIQDVLGERTYDDAVKTLRQIIFVTLFLEIVGAMALYHFWPPPAPHLPWSNVADKLWYATFHSVSAFCNAGFALQPDSLVSMPGWYSNFTIATLIVCGGLGFSVIRNLLSYGYARSLGRLTAMIKKLWIRKLLSTEEPPDPSQFSVLQSILNNYKSEISVQSKFVILISILLIVVGATALTILEWDRYPAGEDPTRIAHALFQSISARTAGFNTIDLTIITTPTVILFIFLMYVGASPGSTGGGIKTTTFATMLISSFGNLSGKDRIHVFERQIPHVAVVRSLMVITFSSLFLLIAVFTLTITEPQVAVEKLIFEAVSAFATVGLSMGVTPTLTVAGKLVIIISMFVGRLGTLAIAMSVAEPRSSEKIYPEEPIMIG